MGQGNQCPPHLCLAEKIFCYQRKERQWSVFSLVQVSSQKLVLLVHDGSLQVKDRDQLALQPRICPGCLCLCCSPEQKDCRDSCPPRRFSRTQCPSPKHWWTLRVEFPDTFKFFCTSFLASTRRDFLCH